MESYEYPLDQERLEGEVDSLFERTDARYFEILNKVQQTIHDESGEIDNLDN